MFDIKRTCREAYDHARRTLYKNNDINNSIQLSMCPTNSSSGTELETKDDASEGRQRLEQECQVRHAAPIKDVKITGILIELDDVIEGGGWSGTFEIHLLLKSLL